MLYQEYKVHPLLAPYIKCIWVLEATAATEAAGKERILPDGSMEMIFHYGEQFRQEVAGYSFLQPRSLLYGQIHRFIDLISPKHVYSVNKWRFCTIFAAQLPVGLQQNT